MINYKNYNFIIILSIFLYLTVLFFSWNLGFTTEDVWHFSAESFQEAYALASQSYNNWNPRIGELFIYFMGIFSGGKGAYTGLWIYRIINPIIITACALFVCRLGAGTWPSNTKSGLITFLFVILNIFCNKTITYWFCSQMNWFYPAVFALAFFIIIEPFFKGINLSTQRFLFALICAPILGMSNESISIVSAVLYITAGISYYRLNKSYNISNKYITIGVILFASSLLFYTAPGLYQRVATEQATTSKIEYAIRNIFSNNWLHVIFWCWRLIFAAILVLLLCPIKAWKTCRCYFLLSAVIMLGGILMLAPCFGAPRALIPVEITFMGVLAGVVYRTLKTHSITNVKQGVLLCTLFCVSLTILIPNSVRSIDNARLFSKLQTMADEEKSKGNNILVIEEQKLATKSVWSFSKFRIPRTLLEIYPLYTAGKPFITTTRECYENSIFEHKYARFPYEKDIDFAGTDLTLNRGMAKFFGLDAIIILRKESNQLSD